MPNFSANISLLYTELPFIERFAAAKADGFEAVECQFPYENSAGCSLADIVEKTTNLALPMTLINLPAGVSFYKSLLHGHLFVIHLVQSTI